MKQKAVFREALHQGRNEPWREDWQPLPEKILTDKLPAGTVPTVLFSDFGSPRRERKSLIMRLS